MTYSIVAREMKEGRCEFGVAVATHPRSVGNRCPHISSRGAIATQGLTNPIIAIEGLKLLEEGYDIRRALERLLAQDRGREERQVIGIDKDSVFLYTGMRCNPAKGERRGTDYVIAGNMLSNEGVLEEMERAYVNSGGKLEERLLEALRAGRDAGGDRRGERSAALLTNSLRIKVNRSREPIEELAQKLQDFAVQS